MNPAFPPTPLTRRAALQRSAVGFGWLAASSLLAESISNRQSAIGDASNPSAAKQPHFAPRR